MNGRGLSGICLPVTILPPNVVSVAVPFGE